MGVTVSNGTMPGGVTPICNSCGISLCWDITDNEYLEDKSFWDSWKCEDCNGSVMSLKSWRAKQPQYKAYAGIGSRETPPDVLELMTSAASRLAELGWILRSGAAPGADMAFERGAGSRKEIFLPWKGFNGNSSKLVEPDKPDQAAEIASLFHPGWHYLSTPAKRLMARNTRQILGLNLDSPVKFVLCWTQDGCEHADDRSSRTGGTGQAIALATRRTSAPVFNMKSPDALHRLKDYLDELRANSN